MRTLVLSVGICCFLGLSLPVNAPAAPQGEFCQFQDDEDLPPLQCGGLSCADEDQCNGSNCEATVADYLVQVIDGICNWAGADGCGAQTCGCCKSYENDIFTGVNLDAPAATPANWCMLGGRGELMGKAAICLLRDLKKHPITNSSAVTSIPDFDIHVEQEIGYLDFTNNWPTNATMRGYHAVNICLPVFGCIDNLTQQFTATLAPSPSPSGFQCGDYPLGEAFVLNMENDDREHGLGVKIDPIATVGTPYGEFSLGAEFRYGTWVKTVTSPYNNGSTTDRRTLIGGPYDGYTALLTDIDVTDGAQAGAEAVEGEDPNGAPKSMSWDSQVGLGGRETNPDGTMWPGLDVSRPDPICEPYVPADMCEQNPARSPAEFVPTAGVTASFKVQDDLTGLIPDDLSPFDPKLALWVKPEVGTTFASQFNVYLSEAEFTKTNPNPDSHDTFLGPSESILRLDGGTDAHAYFSVDTGLDLEFTIDFGFWDKTFEYHPHYLWGPFGGDDYFPDKGLSAQVKSRKTPIGAQATDSIGFEVTPVAENFSSFRGLDGNEVDGDAFIEECFTQPLEPGELPKPSYTKGDPDDILEHMVYPCNICIFVEPITSACKPKAGVDEDHDCGVDQINLQPGEACKDPLCELDEAADSDVSVNQVLYGTGQDAWKCDGFMKTGCYDLCTWDGSDPASLTVVQSAVANEEFENGDGSNRCSGASAGSTNGTGYPTIVACAVDSDCPDDGNVCTDESCEIDNPKSRAVGDTVCNGGVRDGLPCSVDGDCPGDDTGEIIVLPGTCEAPSAGSGTCKRVSAGNIPCDDGLYCNGEDACAGGQCVSHLGDPCSTRGCCDESAANADACGATCGGHFLVCPDPNGFPCDDENACTTGDQCFAGTCHGTSECDDDNPCTDDGCAASTDACVHTYNHLCDNGCGDGVLQAGEECDGANDAACPGLCVPPGDPQTECSCGTTCGNGIVEAALGETCDPPDSPAGPNGNLCRSDCKMCGDGVVQSGDGELCDDGNTAECDPAHPQKALDGCNNECAGVICNDPSRIVGGRERLGEFRFHGKLWSIMGRPVDIGRELSVRLTSGDATIFEAGMPGGQIVQRGDTRTRYYRNPSARDSGGIARVRAVRAVRAGRGSYKMSITAYGNLDGASPDMVTHIISGSREWTVHGRWRQTTSGWVFIGARH